MKGNTMRKTLALAVSLLSTCSFAGVQAPRFGVTINTSFERYCTTFLGSKLNAGQDILVATFNPPQWINGLIIGKTTAHCNTTADLPGTRYEVQLKQIKNGNIIELGVAVVIAPAKLSVESGRPALFISGNENPIIFHECASNEGLHLSAWQWGRRIWHEYYYLRYDVDPTCSKDELR